VGMISTLRGSGSFLPSVGIGRCNTLPTHTLESIEAGSEGSEVAAGEGTTACGDQAIAAAGARHARRAGAVGEGAAGGSMTGATAAVGVAEGVTEGVTKGVAMGEGARGTTTSAASGDKVASRLSAGPILTSKVLLAASLRTSSSFQFHSRSSSEAQVKDSSNIHNTSCYFLVVRALEDDLNSSSADADW